MSLKNCAGDEDREFFLTEGGFLVSNGAFLLRTASLICSNHTRATIPPPNHSSFTGRSPAAFSHSSSPGIFTFTPVSQVEGGACADSWTPSAKPSRIYDCFMFFNELAMLRLRLRVHSPIVDFFVIRCKDVILRFCS